MAKMSFDRRSILRGGLGGVVFSLGLPTLECMLNAHGTALADGTAIPKRFGLWWWGNGVRRAKWIPSRTGSDWALSEELAPLQAHKPYINLPTGMDIKTPNSYAHHGGAVGILTGAPLTQQFDTRAAFASTVRKPSIDMVAAAHLAKKDEQGRGPLFRSLELSVTRRSPRGEGTTVTAISHNGPDSVNMPESDPIKVWERLFMNFKPSSDEAASAAMKKLLTLRKSVLDVVQDDLKALSSQVGVNDRRRIDEHSSNIRIIEERLSKLAVTTTQPVCEVPAKPSTLPASDGWREPLEECNAAISEIAGYALACDLTRVFSIQFTSSVSEAIFTKAGASTGNHELTHFESGDQAQVNKNVIWTMQQFAVLLASLKKHSIGSDNLLDHTAIFASTCASEGKDHSINDYPVVIAGRAGGALKYPGVHHRSNSRENVSKVHLSVLRAVGAPVTEFGGDAGRVTEGLSAIEA